MADDLCVVCRRRPPHRGHVCDGDRTGLAEMLRDVPRQLIALELQIVPGAAAQGEKVATTRVGSPAPARIDALSLVGPGSEHVGVTALSALHPLIRRWRADEHVTVTYTVAGKTRTEQRTITVWHRELARDGAGRVIELADDDQVGVIPPREWLDATVRAWRRHFGHHVPPRTRYQPPAELDDSRARARRLRQLFAAFGTTTGAAAPLAYVAVTEASWRNYVSGRLLGMYPPRGAYVDDHLADEWELRFGEPPRHQAHLADIKYLLTWLDEACDQDVHIADFAGQLRALHAELARVLGEQPDQQWLGRCPATIVTGAGTDNETKRVCGAGLWQDPYVQQVMCPHCHSTWGPREVDLLLLAKEIRRVWPIDRRRRYDYDARATLLSDQPRCPNCSTPIVIRWRDVTEPGDRTRWWRPDKTSCPMGCVEAEKII